MAPGPKEKFILNENLVMGPVRIRQLRVRNDSCAIHELFQKQFDECYGEYKSLNEDQSPYGLKNGTEYKLDCRQYFSKNSILFKYICRWTYHTEDDLNGMMTWGKINTYPGSGYYYDFSSDLTQSLETLSTFRNNNWIDRATRVVFIQFSIYNANINKFCLVK